MLLLSISQVHVLIHDNSSEYGKCEFLYTRVTQPLHFTCTIHLHSDTGVTQVRSPSIVVVMG